jgi:hypothetical protein
MKKLILIGLILLSCHIAEAKTATLYCRSDTHTINGLTANILAITNSSASGYFEKTITANFPAPGTTCHGDYQALSIAILHADGSETSLGTVIANTSQVAVATEEYRTATVQGVQSATFVCPSTTLMPTDALKIIWYEVINTTPANSNQATWVSAQLGWARLNSATWTLYRYSYASATLYGSGYPYYGHAATVRLYYGDSTHATYIDGIDYQLSGGYATIY